MCCDAYVEVRAQRVGIGSLLEPRVCQGWSSDHQVGRLALLRASPSLRP